MRKNRTLPATPESHPRRVPLLHGPPSRSESLKPHSVNLRVIPFQVVPAFGDALPAATQRDNIARSTKQNKINSKPAGLQKGSLGPLLCPCLVPASAAQFALPATPCGPRSAHPPRLRHAHNSVISQSINQTVFVLFFCSLHSNTPRSGTKCLLHHPKQTYHHMYECLKKEWPNPGTLRTNTGHWRAPFIPWCPRRIFISTRYSGVY
jgi:hypothetical protein